MDLGITASIGLMEDERKRQITVKNGVKTSGKTIKTQTQQTGNTLFRYGESLSNV
jgi:hypothetical protein